MKIVSVIIPCFNAQATLARTLASCLQQSNVGEIVVVDDGSTDGSCDIVRKFMEIHSHVRLLNMPENGGPARARNWGALQAFCDILAFIDADDEYIGDALALATRALVEHPELSSVRLGVEFSGFPEDICQHPSFQEAGHVLCNTFAGNLVIRKEVFLAMGAFPQTPIFRAEGGEDGALSLALSTNTLVGTCYETLGVRVYYHPGAHAEKFFRVKMNGNDSADNLEGSKKEVWDNSMQYVQMAGMRLQRLLAVGNGPRKGFAPLLITG